jgi:glycerophosphoryl diester phosphodiesterase
MAFEKAAELGSDMVELDLRLTADDVPVVSHDENLQRLFGIEARVADLTLEQLRAQTDIMTFAEVVEVCCDLLLGLYLDIKAINPAGAEQVFAALGEFGMTPYAIFSSFQPDIVAEIKAMYPQAQTSILFHSTHVDPLLLARALQADYVHPCWEHEPEPHRLLTADWLAQVRAAGLGVICWHEERPAEIAALKALGVTGICSDNPELLR